MTYLDVDWEIRKTYLIRSLFEEVPSLSPIPEIDESESSQIEPQKLTPEVDRPCSPLPPLIIEREPNKHDHSEEFYLSLEKKMRSLYRKLFIEGSSVSFAEISYDTEFDINVTPIPEETIDFQFNEETRERTPSSTFTEIIRSRSKESSSKRNGEDVEDISDEITAEVVYHYEGSNQNADATFTLSAPDLSLSKTGTDQTAEVLKPSESTSSPAPSFNVVTFQADVHREDIPERVDDEIESRIYEESIVGAETGVTKLEHLREVAGDETDDVDLEVLEEEVTGDEVAGAGFEHFGEFDGDEPISSELEEMEEKVSCDETAGAELEELEEKVSCDETAAAELEELQEEVSGGEISGAEDEALGEEVADNKTAVVELDDLEQEVAPEKSAAANETQETIVIEEMRTPRIQPSRDSMPNPPSGDESSVHSIILNDRVLKKLAECTEECSNKEKDSSMETDNSVDHNFSQDFGFLHTSTPVVHEQEINSSSSSSLDDSISNVRKRKASSSITERAKVRRCEYVPVQMSERISWDFLKKNFFVGDPKMFRLCRCKDHSCCL